MDDFTSVSGPRIRVTMMRVHDRVNPFFTHVLQGVQQRLNPEVRQITCNDGKTMTLTVNAGCSERSYTLTLGQEEWPMRVSARHGEIFTNGWSYVSLFSDASPLGDEAELGYDALLDRAVQAASDFLLTGRAPIIAPARRPAA